MKHFLLITLALLFFVPIPFVHAEETGVLFRRKVYGKLGWYPEGDEKKNEKYLGKIENGKPNGKGTLTHPNGGIYVGGFKDRLTNGLGTLNLPDGKKYDGEWKKGIKD